MPENDIHMIDVFHGFPLIHTGGGGKRDKVKTAKSARNAKKTRKRGGGK